MKRTYRQRLYSGRWWRQECWHGGIIGLVVGWWWWRVGGWRQVGAGCIRIGRWYRHLAGSRCCWLDALALKLGQFLPILFQLLLQPRQLLTDGEKFALNKLSGSEDLHCPCKEILLLRMHLARKAVNGRT